VTSVAGGAKFKWLGRLVKVLSNLKRTLSPRANVFARLAAIATVPGPTRLPTRQLPMGPAGVGLNALMLKYALGVIRQVSVADAVGPLECPATDQVQISRIVARACQGGQIWARLPHADRADRPTAKERLWD
jgi:hypothetical protein